MGIKTVQERTKNTSYEEPQTPRAVTTLEASKVNDGTCLLLHKPNDGSTQWIEHYTIYKHRHENVL
ncbi:hypothetical protein [Bartonella pachyuromydis]|uniref:Uncharacterized protein n=1 Tax=Bartonella pachyuromydis TaxID=931097 RepID=A0ABP8VJR9_9HYPH